MALWGNNAAVESGGTVTVNYTTLEVLGSGTTFGSAGFAKTGQTIEFGTRAGTWHGTAVIVGIASTTNLSIASTAGLSGAAIAATSFFVSEQPVYASADPHFSELNTAYDAVVYGVNGASGVVAEYEVTHEGWVGVTTYTDTHGNLRVKKETLVAMSGITTSAAGTDALTYPTKEG